MKTSIKYYLEIRNSLKNGDKDSFPLVLSCTYGGLRMKMHLAMKVNIKEWDGDKQCFSAACAEYKPLNAWLVKLREVCNNNVIQLWSESGVPAPEVLRSKIKGDMPLPCLSFFNAFLEFMQENHHSWTKNTYLKVRALYSLLRKYQEFSGENILLGSLEEQEFKRIENFYSDVMGFSVSTIKGYMNILKWFLHWAVRKNYYYNPRLRFFKITNEKDYTRRVDVFLSRDELFQLKDLKGLTKRQERVRDVFCFMCFTGVKYTVLKSLKKQDIIDNSLQYSFFGRNLTLPLNSYASGIINKYERVFFRQNTLLPVYSVVTVNKYLKQLAKKCNFDREIRISLNGQASQSSFPLHECLSVKHAWNTFLMNGLLLGVSEESLKRIAGAGSGPAIKRFRNQLYLKDKAEIKKFNSL